MADKVHSAEKDLLRLIENPGEVELKKAENAGKDAAEAEPVKKISLFSFSKRRKDAGSKKRFDVKTLLTDRRQILRVLFFLVFCAFVFFVVTVAREYSKSKNTKNLVKFTYISQGKEARTSESLSGDSGGGADSYLEKEIAGIRNIFKPDSVKKEEEKKDEGHVSLADYRLVGISQSSDPKEVYAMIKNVKTNITFFLKKEEKLDGMELVQIFENRILLKVRGKEVELR